MRKWSELWMILPNAYLVNKKNVVEIKTYLIKKRYWLQKYCTWSFKINYKIRQCDNALKRCRLTDLAEILIWDVHDLLWGSSTLDWSVGKGKESIALLEVLECLQSLIDMKWGIVGAHTWSLKGLGKTLDLLTWSLVFSMYLSFVWVTPLKWILILKRGTMEKLNEI